MNVPKNTKPWLQGAAVGAVAAVIVGFGWGGWVTGGSSDKHALEAKKAGRVAAFTEVCVNRFNTQPDATAKLAALSKINSSWEQGKSVASGGFATFPGSKDPDSDVAHACAEALAAQKNENKT